MLPREAAVVDSTASLRRSARPLYGRDSSTKREMMLGCPQPLCTGLQHESPQGAKQTTSGPMWPPPRTRHDTISWACGPCPVWAVPNLLGSSGAFALMKTVWGPVLRSAAIRSWWNWAASTNQGPRHCYELSVGLSRAMHGARQAEAQGLGAPKSQSWTSSPQKWVVGTDLHEAKA